MIGKFCPLLVTAAAVTAARTTVNVRSTDAASEIVSDVEWIYWN